MNRFTPDDLIAKGYVKVAGSWLKPAKGPEKPMVMGQWAEDLIKKLSPTKKAPESLYMPKATPKPSKRRKTAALPRAWAASTFMGKALDLGLRQPRPEHRFDLARRWRFDFAWPIEKVAVEVEGGVWIQGRHTRGSGFVKDMEKYNRAAELGWRILRVQPQDLLKPAFLTQLRSTLTPE